MVLIAAAFASQSATASAAPMYFGATIDGDVYGQASDPPWNTSVWNTFEQHAGKKTAILNMGQAWGQFDTSAFQAVRNHGAVPLVTTWLDGTSLADIVAGNQDAVIRAWAQKAKAWGYPFLFRPWWEMNGNWYPWGRSPDFVAAWRRFHDIVVQEGATNVTWAWITNSIWNDPASDPAPYYPGSAYVDWVGMDTYNWGANPIQAGGWTTPDQTITPTLNRLKQIAPGKPVCICEDASTEIGGNKANWIRDMLGTYLPTHPDIKAFLWFNWNVPQNGGRWDWQIESSKTAQQAFRKGIASSTYRSTLPTLTPLAKLPLP
jgi:beta-mannanase